MPVRDTWASGDAYEPYVGRWSRLVARKFLGWIGAPAGSRWLDVGCGTGALTEAILQFAAPEAVVGVEPSIGFVAFAHAHVGDRRASFATGDAQALPIAADTFHGVVSGLTLNFVPRQDVGLAEMVRAARRGGFVAAYVWDYGGRMEMMRVFWDAAIEMDPTVAELDEGRRFPICQPGPLAALFSRAGLADVRVRAIEVVTRFRDFEDYWSPFLGGQGPAPSLVAALAGERRTVLRERIRSKLPIARDGIIALSARAWAVRGRK